MSDRVALAVTVVCALAVILVFPRFLAFTAVVLAHVIGA